VILNWAKPKKVMSTEEWESISACGAPPGVYVPNMSDEDMDKWNAKITGTKSGNPQIEIRSSRGRCQMVCIVSLKGSIKYQKRVDKCNIRISMNSPLQLSFADWTELNLAIDEAKEKLEELCS